MKRFLLAAICALPVLTFNSLNSNAQSVSITDDGTVAHASAMLEVKVSGANKKGVLIPRMTTAQRNAIASPAKGLLVYDSTSKNFFFHNGTAWTPISSGAPNSWAINGIHTYNTNPGNIGIGLSNPKAKLNVAPNRSVLFGPDTLSSVGGSQFVFFASKAAIRFRTAYSSGAYPEPMPYNYNVIGENSLAIGETTAEDYGFAIGNASSAGSNGFAQGFGSSAGDGGFARGTFTAAIGTGSFASGVNCFSTGQLGFAHGDDLEAKARGCFVIGVSNDPIATSSETNWVHTDPIFMIGNGGFTATKSNAFVILKNGVTGIGFTPTADVASWGMLQVKNTTGKDHLTLVQSSSANRWGASVPDAGTADLFLKYNGVSKGKFSNVNGAYTLVSDFRLKKDITPLDEVMPKLMRVKAYQYHYIDNNNNDPLSNGFIAQEVAEIFPSFVSKVDERNGEKMLGIDYNNFTVMAIKGIQEQQQIIGGQQQVIERQQKQIDELLKRVEKLESQTK
jgi:hypothetical protein